MKSFLLIVFLCMAFFADAQDPDSVVFKQYISTANHSYNQHVLNLLATHNAKYIDSANRMGLDSLLLFRWRIGLDSLMEYQVSSIYDIHIPKGFVSPASATVTVVGGKPISKRNSLPASEANRNLTSESSPPNTGIDLPPLLQVASVPPPTKNYQLLCGSEYRYILQFLKEHTCNPKYMEWYKSTELSAISWEDKSSMRLKFIDYLESRCK